jgi:hypothetical protein
LVTAQGLVPLVDGQSCGDEEAEQADRQQVDAADAVRGEEHDRDAAGGSAQNGPQRQELAAEVVDGAIAVAHLLVVVAEHLVSIGLVTRLVSHEALPSRPD